MVGRKRFQFGVQVNDGGVNPNPLTSGGFQNFDICMNLCNGNSKRRAVIYYRMFTKEDYLTRPGWVKKRKKMART